MIDRYCLAPMQEIWTTDATLLRWTRVESLVARVQADLGVIPADAAVAIAAAPVPTLSAVHREEAQRDHEVLSFLSAWTQAMPPEAARWVHHGLTSYDLVDTALGIALRDATHLLVGACDDLVDRLATLALTHWDTLCVGRTHGIHAEPTTFGHKMAVHAFEVARAADGLRAAEQAVSVATLSGPVGTYSSVTPAVEAAVCDQLGLQPENVPSQVVARDRHARALSELALTSACVEHLALELRLLQRTEVAEVEEPRAARYQGSSAMPHKRNPTTSERLCGLARLVRAYAGAALEDVSLWHERDLAHSSVERVALPDAFNLVYYQLREADALVAGLIVNESRMAANLGLTRGLVYSAAAYEALLAGGLAREDAYRAVQRASDEAATNPDLTLVGALERAGHRIHPERLEPVVFLRHHEALRTRLEVLLAGRGGRSA